MAGNATSLTHLELIGLRSTPSEQEVYILNALNLAIHPATWETAKEAARLLDATCPPLDQHEEILNYLWMIWDIMTDIARSPDVESAVQESLIRVLESLRFFSRGDLTFWGGVYGLWKDLPRFSEVLESGFNDPSLEPKTFTEKDVQIWRKVNSFGARCLRAGVGGPYAQAMYALRSGLEEDTGATDLKVQVACDWVIHGGKPLLWWARENIGYEDVPVEDEASYVEGGNLYTGPQTMCLKRWGFWMDRLEHLGKDESESGLSEEVRKTALEAAQTMRGLETRIGHTLSEG